MGGRVGGVLTERHRGVILCPFNQGILSLELPEVCKLNERPFKSGFWSLGLGGGFPGGSENKESACNVGDLGSLPG